MAAEGVKNEVFNLGPLYFYECPLLWITADTQRLMTALFIFDDKGLMPFRGLWTEQPAWFIEAYEIYKDELIKWQKQTSKS